MQGQGQGQGQGHWQWQGQGQEQRQGLWQLQLQGQGQRQGQGGQGQGQGQGHGQGRGRGRGSGRSRGSGRGRGRGRGRDRGSGRSRGSGIGRGRVAGCWLLVGPPEATAKPKGGRRKIAAPNRPQGGLLGPARVGRSGQPVTAQPAPPGAVTSRKSFVLGGEGGLRVGVVEVPFLGGGGGSAGLRKGRSGAVCGYAWAQDGAAQGAARSCAGA